ncbi:MAG: hypothetical protein CVU87_01975 [Firmicutes bacterium HGW-Firmicutes-12]|nr:MAG: hypothetical protein CVU87_01975 [Firmicutes bacterium HGW-Firmicutes-12]
MINKHFRNIKKDNNTIVDNNSLRIVILGCITIVVALISMSILSMIITSNAVLNKLKTSDLQNMARSISVFVEGKIDKALDISVLLANDPTVVEWIQKEEQSRLEGEIVQVKMAELVNDFEYDVCFLTSAVTNHYWSYSSVDKEFVLLDTVTQTDSSDMWFFETLKMKKKYDINIDHNKELNDTYVWINTLVGDINQPLAVSGVGMNLSKVINQLIEDEEENEINNDILLVDGEGQIYLSKKPEYLEKSLTEYLPGNLVQEILRTNNLESKFDIADYETPQGEYFDIAYKKIKNTDWNLIVQIPRADSLGFLKAIIINTIISCILIILIIVLLFYFISNKIANPYKRALLLNEELEEKVKERTKELVEKNNRIKDSIEYAKMIQQTILPSSYDMGKCLKEYFIIYEPRDIVGGDFYWLKSHSKGYLVIVGDCTGHGVPGALMATAVNAMLNHVVDGICNDNPAVILYELDRLLKQSFKMNHNEKFISDGVDLGIIYIEEHKVIFSGANISVFVVDGNKIDEIKGNNCTIDYISEQQDKVFENYEIAYKQGVTLYMVTDGLIEQPGGEKGYPFGRRRFTNLIEAASKLEMDIQSSYILNTIKEYADEQIIRDDLTLLGFRL